MKNIKLTPPFQGFQFKQFRIEHKHCAMKVGTDSIMLGSWIKSDKAPTILDIGTGSGLLAIMLAQKAPQAKTIIGVDINQEAIKQANINGRLCPWAERLHFIHSDIAHYQPTEKFDLIVANPPYFAPAQKATRAYQGLAAARKQARLTDSLDFSQLMQAVSRLLAAHGRFYCVLPLPAMAELEQAAMARGLYKQVCLQVRNQATSQVIRQLAMFAEHKVKVKEQHLVIRNDDHSYSDSYKQLCVDYYLNF